MFRPRIKALSSIIKQSFLPLKYELRAVHYVQGQEPEPKIREYFYFIDHQGMVSTTKFDYLWTIGLILDDIIQINKRFTYAFSAIFR